MTAGHNALKRIRFRSASITDIRRSNMMEYRASEYPLDCPLGFARRRHSSTILSCAGRVFQALVLRLNWLPERILEFVEKKEADVVE